MKKLLQGKLKKRRKGRNSGGKEEGRKVSVRKGGSRWPTDT